MTRALATLLIAAALFVPTNEEGLYCDQCDIYRTRPPEPWTCIAGGRPVWKMFCRRFWFGESDDDEN